MNVMYCSETQDLEKYQLKNNKWGRWHSLNENCSYYDVIDQNLQFAPTLYDVISDVTDNIFLKIIMFKVAKILDPKHYNPI